MAIFKDLIDAKDRYQSYRSFRRHMKNWHKKQDGGFRQRKANRTEHYFKYQYKWKIEKCVACNGSGRYDNTNAPKCSSCDGTGKTRIPPKDQNESPSSPVYRPDHCDRVRHMHGFTSIQQDK